MIIRQEVITLVAFVNKFDELLDGSEIVAQVKIAGRLDSRNYNHFGVS
jgi:hypothetical protein